jgi:signal transduction histidine kinase
LFWLLAFQNRREKNLLLIAVTTTVLTLDVFCDQYIITRGISYSMYQFLGMTWAVLTSIGIVLCVVVVVRLFNRTIGTIAKVMMVTIFASGLIHLIVQSQVLLILQLVLAISLLAYYVVTSWKSLRGAQWAVLIGLVATISLGLALSILGVINPEAQSAILLVYTGLFLSFPVSLLVYVAIRFREIINDVRRNAREVVRLSEEKKEQALNQQKILEAEVKKQTAELRETLDNLRTTQTQLIQSEKMASLGELTAGIAHEIQNPLNFVNNFSEVNAELVDELDAELAIGNMQLAKEIAANIKENEKKISEHGKRADSIVKGMLQHSRSSSGQKESTDINELVDEYQRLAFHGHRAKDKSFTVKIETNYDSSLGKIDIVPQDLGRVVLNLINNAFYAVDIRRKQNRPGYYPCVKIVTAKTNGKVEIKVIDNGDGIPSNVLGKIFQPFFTTKPTGHGTGLGLSLSYDIITRGHGGELKVETKEQVGSEFIILLPA